MYVLGVNSVFHESAACLLEDGRLVATVEEERFNRIKHAKIPLVDNANELPLQAIAWCLETAGIDLRLVDHVGYSSDPKKWRVLRGGDYPLGATVEFAENMETVPRDLQAMGFRGEFHWIDHHTAHAASAFFPSPFDSAAVLTVDGIGDGNTTAGFRGDGSTLQPVFDVPSPHSIGFLWELAAMFLGFGIYDATKIMGLSAYGDPTRFESAFRLLIRQLPEGQFRVDRARLRFSHLDYSRHTGYFRGLEEVLELPKRRPGDELKQEHYDLAAALQSVTDEVLLHVVSHLHGATQSRNLCLAGGVALNCVSNRRVFEDGPFERLFIQPAANDAGTAIGAACHVRHHLLGFERGEPMRHAYLGPAFSPAQIEDAIRRRGLQFRRCDNIESEVAEVLARGEIVSFFQGPMEVGPRALGNRSLLADPRNPNMRDILNAKVKHREFFRPFAPSVLLEEAERWFQIARPTTAAEYMLMAYPVQEDVRNDVPAVVHADGTCRVQVVRREANPRFHRLISEFQKRTGVPIVLNTSFNDSEPIVCTPDDAIDTFLKTNIDHLAMGDFFVAKSENRDVQRLANGRRRATIPQVFPDLQSRFEAAVAGRRVARANGDFILTDASSRQGADSVHPLLEMQSVLLDELPLERFRDASILDLYAGSGSASLAAAGAGARRVVAVERNHRARSLAVFNAVLNGCEDVVDVCDASNGIWASLKNRRFDGVLCHAPLARPTNASKAGRFGLGIVEQVLQDLDGRLNPNGFARILTVSPGAEDGPCILLELADRHLAGSTIVRVVRESKRYNAWVDELQQFGSIGPQTSRFLKLRAARAGWKRCFLCVICYEAGGPKQATFETSKRSCSGWLNVGGGFELSAAASD